MALATRSGIDSAGGGTITSAGQGFVKIGGELWIVVGDPVASHGTGGHASATMAAGSSFVSINGVPVCRLGDAATCGHTATGSGFVDVDS